MKIITTNLRLILIPTQECNFRCTYCYEKFKPTFMDEMTQKNIISLIEKKVPTIKNLTISWFGGEPLLKKDIVISMSSMIYKLLESNPQLNFFSEMTTNASLLDYFTFERLVDNGITCFQITLDGYKDAHNQLRQGKHGEPTFDRIWEKLLVIKKSKKENFKVILRSHYHKENIDDILYLKEKLIETFSGDNRFKFFFRPLSRLGGDNDYCIDEIYDERIDLSIKESIPKENQFVIDSSYSICYAANPMTFVVFPNGNIGKCTVALEDSIIGRIANGGKLLIDEKLHLPWFKGLFENDEKYNLCPKKFIYNEI